MNEELSKICRICLAEGSQNIFHHNRRNVDSISSLDRILEKLRFVTMLKIQPTDCLPGMICDSCIVQLNVAYSFKMKAIESDTKLHQYAIEKGFSMQETSYNSLAITDGSCNFIVPEPLHQQRSIAHTVIQSESSTAIQQEYLRHFETPQSMASTQNPPTTASQQAQGIQQPFRCMPIQIKIEPMDDYMASSEVSPAVSDENLQTVSDSSSIRSNENLSGSSMVCVNKKTKDNSSDKSFVNAYISSGSSDTTKMTSTTNSPEEKKTSLRSSSIKSSPRSPLEKKKVEKTQESPPVKTRRLRSMEDIKAKEQPKPKRGRKARNSEPDILLNSFNTVKLGSTSKRKQNEDNSLTTKRGRKISFIHDLSNNKKRNAQNAENSPKEDKRRKEVRDRLKTNKKTRT
ncbi:uncharacterized protein LOC134837261 [Culicoides brevitarsis]|uniref:uncharacterized protein LOC134837261 n=1 Tax=Culicoides brevitarsis TaxID=469753 RepID=UPI00307C5DA3